MPTRSLTWSDFNEAAEQIASRYRHDGLIGVHGIARGGLPLAVAVSHRLDLPLLDHGGPNVLVIDDIHDSGQTLAQARQRYPGSRFCVWVTRQVRPEGYGAVLTDIGQDWLCFPWEDRDRVEQDRQRYEAAR
ncbi:hypothetical protein U5801_11705 [Lamprobacter modestohalophilus]|uniref:phosphoribosyltransferase n=1 Tax=Lamprobacter modestohalophilus TaxID=1064514 RepID=UPI002ADED823|nr:hypothetical protein [Lamprobacter modestohalophilus]MEA1050469.1 hypothetical protein [Lamprobacter modestohalophilus]